MTTLNKFRYLTESGTSYEEWLEEAPTYGPDGVAVSGVTVTITDTLADKEVKAEILEEKQGLTGGHFQSICIVLATSSGTQGEWYEVDKSWPFPVSILSAEFNVSENHVGDEIECMAVPNKIIGIVTQNLTTSGVTFSVSPTVIENIKVGLYITVTDGVNLDQLGRVYEIDEEESTVTIETAPSNSYSAASPTYFMITAKFVEYFELVTAGRHTIGDTKIGSSFLPANEKLRFRYKNNDGQTKKFGVVIEYLY